MLTIVLTFLKGFIGNYWKQLILIVAISTLAYTTYHRIKTIGYNEGFKTANTECIKKNKEFTDKLDTLIVTIENNSSKLVSESVEARKVLKKDISTILLTIKNKPLYIIEQGQCKPSDDFINAYNQAVDRINTP
jgi:hypothetical protein